MCMTMRMATVEEHRQEVADLSSRRHISSSEDNPTKQFSRKGSESSSRRVASVNAGRLGLLMLSATVSYFRLDEKVVQHLRHISFHSAAGSAANDPRMAICYVLALLLLLQQMRFRGVEEWFRFFVKGYIFRENPETEQGHYCPMDADEYTMDPLPRTNSKQGLCRNSSSETISKLSTSIRNFSINNCRKLRPRGDADAVLSSQEPFASVEDVSGLSLRDLTQIFRYIMIVNRNSFQRSEFVSSVSPMAKQVISDMDFAVMASRGPNVELNIISESCQSGDIDALYFAAAVRIYTEWRTACLVPEGYKRYSLGVAMARRDILQNIEKIESAAHSWIEAAQINEEDEDTFRSEDIQVISPTLRDLLVHEKETEVHSQLPCLAEVSGANGLLWIKRQLQLVNTTFIKSLQVPTLYETTRAASDAAYKEIYGPYHGWAVQQIFRQSSNKSPDFDVVLKLLEKGFNYEDIDDPASSDETTDTIKPEQTNDASTLENPLDNVVEHIGREWERLVHFLSRFNCQDIAKEQRKLSGPIVSATDMDQSAFRRKQFLQVPMRTASDISNASVDDDSIESVDCHYPQNLNVHKELEHHTEQMTRVLEEVTGLIAELNMNDPSKV